MDIYCPKCGEPWDHDTLHEVADENRTSYEQVAADFRNRGCLAFNADHSHSPDLDMAQKAQAIYIANGDDMDAAAVSFEEV